jgi:hypothetical protein
MSFHNNDNWSLVGQGEVGRDMHMSRELLMSILGRTHQDDDMPAIYGGHSNITTSANAFLFAPFKHECSRQEIN